MIRFIRFDGNGPRIVRVPRWALVLVLVAALLVGLLMLVLAAGIALVAIPVALAAGAVAALVGRGRAVRPSSPQGGRRGEVIDAEYRVIEDRRREF